MRSSTPLPRRFPAGTKYIVEGFGKIVRRYIEFPNGRRLKLKTRKAFVCACLEREQVSLVPEHKTEWPTTEQSAEVSA